MSVSANITSICMIVASSLSIVSCFSLCTYLMKSKKLTTVSSKIIFLVALCDLFSAIGTVWGLTKSGSVLCWLQSMLTQIFPLASAWWTMMISLHVVFTIQSRPVEANFFLGWRSFLVCFGLPVVVTLLPFTTSTYGCRSDEEVCWCFVIDLKSSPAWAGTVWHIVAFFLWIWLFLIVSICLFMYCMFFVMSMPDDEGYRKKLLEILFKLLGYPLVLIISWTVTGMFDMIVVTNPVSPMLKGGTLASVSYVMPCLQGFFAGLVWIVTHWRKEIISQDVVYYVSAMSKIYDPSKMSRVGVDVQKYDHVRTDTNTKPF